MVFEALVVDLLNKILKQYIENLDTSQLKIGIWGGDVVLQDLKIRTSLFDDLQLPVKVKWGRLEKLIMKIPWKNLYTSQAVINIEGLLLVIIPESQVVYDPVKEEKWEFEKKQAKLKAIEEARKRELLGDPVKEDDTFIEKLATQIIKNLQVVIKNIHVRYEDKVTNPGSPFSVGVTLSNLSAETIVKDPSPDFSEFMKANLDFICKLVHLEGLGLYWNSKSEMYSDLAENDLKKVLYDNVPRADFTPESYSYMVGPIIASAFLRINPKPELDNSNYTIPKIFFNVHLKKIDLAVNHGQFCDLMSFSQGFQKHLLASKYRKYRPAGVPVIGHANEWWHFAYRAVAQDIIRRKKEWAWPNIKKHREMCKKYYELFKTKLNSKKLNADLEQKLTDLEKHLNVLNLVLIREQAYMDVERDKVENLKKQAATTSNKGWFSGWFGSTAETKSQRNEDEIVKKIESVMTSQEKQKLYKAIGYEERAPPTKYPASFVEIKFLFQLDEIKTTIFDDRMVVPEPIMIVSIKTVKMDIEQRSSALAMKFSIIIGKFQVTGKQEPDLSYPELVTSSCKEKESLVEVLYETTPLDGTCDQRLIVNARPLRVVFHAETINFVKDIFVTENYEEMETLVAATSASLPTFQKITLLGLQYSIQKKTVLELKIHIMSSYLIIPYGGIYDPNKDMLVIMLGDLCVETEAKHEKDYNVKQLYLEGTTVDEIFSTVLSASYTKFNCQLRGVQILFQLSGEDWVEVSKRQEASPMRFLESTNLEVIIKKSMVLDDPRIPKMIVEGNLPSLTFNFSEERFVSLVALAFSLPKKAEKPIAITKSKVSASSWSMQSQPDTKFLQIHKGRKEVKPTQYVQGIDFVGHFEMNELMVIVSKTSDSKKKEKEKNSKDSKKPVTEEHFLTLGVVKMEIEFTKKTFEMVQLFKLGGIDFKQYHKKRLFPCVASKEMVQDYYLFVVEFINLDTKAPDFYTTKGAIINRLTLNMAPLNILLNKEALLALLTFVSNVQEKTESVKGANNYHRMADAGTLRETVVTEEIETSLNDKKVLTKGKRFRSKRARKEVIDFFLQASLDEVNITVEFEGEGLAEFGLHGGSIELSTRKAYMNVDLNILEVFILDLNPNTIHKKIAASLEKQTLTSRVTLYNKEYYGEENSVDMSVDAELGRIQFTFVNVFFSRVFEFLNAFQSQVNSFKAGASVAAQKAKENVIKAFQNASQICLNVKITAPLLLVPRSSKSLEALVFDLGKVTLKNSISELECALDEGKESGRPLLDIAKLHLMNLKFSRCTLNKNSMQPEVELNFLVPVTFDLTLKRNLSLSWFKTIPDLEILARLASIHISLTHQDLCTILNVLQENLSEGQEKLTKSKSLESLEKEPRSSRAIDRPIGPTMKPNEGSGEKEATYTQIKFVFFMDSFIFDAVNSISQKKNDEAEVSGLARFVLESMSVKGRYFSDMSAYISIMLMKCFVDDTRPGKEGRLTRIMERSGDSEVSEPENTVKHMFELLYQKKEEDSFVDIRVYKFTLVLSMDLLQKLGGFFILDETASQRRTETVEKTKKSSKDAEKLAAKESNASGRPPTFTLNLRLEKPDIIIVENMDSINTDALMFHTEMLMKYRVSEEKQVISGTLADIELYSCCFNPSKRRRTMRQVIKPFTISVAGSTPEGAGLHIDVCVSEIFITINPNTVDLVSKCFETLMTNSSLDEKHSFEKIYFDLWSVKSFDPNSYWFLQPEEGIDVLQGASSLVSLKPEGGKDNEICLVAIPSTIIFLEGSGTSQEHPFLTLEMGFHMQCYNWSQKLSITNTLKLLMKYYNYTLSAWEPLLEPVEHYSEKENKYFYEPWELNCSVVHEGEGEMVGLNSPKVQVTLSCSDHLQLTLTKTCLDVLKSAADCYTTAVTQHIVKRTTDTPPYIIKNRTGLSVELLLDKSKMQVCTGLLNDYDTVRLDSESEVELQNTSLHISDFRENNLSMLKKEAKLFIKFPSIVSYVFELPLGLASKRYFPFPPGEFSKTKNWGLVCSVSISENTTTVVLQSILKVVNYFLEAINIYALSEDTNKALYVGTVEGNSSFTLPFNVVYGSDNKLFFSVDKYSLCLQPFEWENLKEEPNMSVFMQCNSKTPETNDPFFIQAVGETDQIYYAHTNRKSSASMIYEIHLQPLIKIFNALPVTITILSQGNADEKLLQPGNIFRITTAEPGTSYLTIRIMGYLEKDWSCKELILEHPSEFLIWEFTSYTGLAPETLNLGIHVTYARKAALYTLYCPYFMVNKTEHLLSYKFENSSTVFYHPGDYESAVMFSPTAKKFFSKKMASLQLEQSSWSDKFPVDVAGSGGTVECKDRNSDVVYKISITISLTTNSLTKVVIFTPFYVFINSAECFLLFRECDLPNEPWQELPPKTSTPFWPRSQAKVKTIQLKPKNSEAVTPPFRYDSTDSCLLRLNDKLGGIFVVIKGTQSGTYVEFRNYEPGQAPVLIINYSLKTIELQEKLTEYKITLKPFEEIMHAWICPTGQRKLVLMQSAQKTAIDLEEDIDDAVFTFEEASVRYASFFDGTQRILLFSEDKCLTKSLSSLKMVASGLEVVFKIQGFGLSFVNNEILAEVLYLGFMGTDIIWECKKLGKSGRYKRMPESEASHLETAYIKYKNDLESGVELSPVVEISGKLVANFETMELMQPHQKELRRTFEPGLWMIYRVIGEQRMLHMKINRIQVDNPVHGCVFPVVLAPIPPPKTVVSASQGPKPFFELSIVKMAADKNGVEQYKYFQILIQEFHVKIDMSLIQQISKFWTSEDLSDEALKANFIKDLEFLSKPLMSHVEVVSSYERKNFFDLLHFSPLKIHFSFSMAGKIEKMSLPPSLSVMLQSLGVTLTDAHDVIFRLSYFERKSAFLTNGELTKEVISHYYGQMIRQAYVLLLGLDVIGNPFGLIVGIGEGVEAFFYEPFQGMIRSPAEFGIGITIGCKNLIGRTVGSAADTLGKLTETLGRGLAVLSLDKEYQLERMEERSRNDNIQASMARGGKDLVMGVYEGVTGVVKKPLKGAKEEGVGGFFKGMGKGVLGLVTRPVTGVIDFASTSLNAVKRATATGSENTRVRPPRFFRDDIMVQPYNLRDAEGNEIMFAICKRKYCNTDKYEYHLVLKGKEMLLLTNKRLILAELSEVFGTWQEHLSVLWKSMTDRPHSHSKGIALNLPGKIVSGKKGSPHKILLIEDREEKKEAYKKMIELYLLENEESESAAELFENYET